MTEELYISFVVAARNDNYGGDFFHRFQVFLNAFIKLREKYNLNAEVIIVDWNHVEGSNKISESLVLPEGVLPDNIRIITVPSDIHLQIPNSDRMPMFEYIAKNVGIQRAKGRFVLATNPDILFSEEIFAFLSSNQLSPECYYRANRFDVLYRIPLNLPVERQLRLCYEHAFRVNSVEGTMPISGILDKQVHLDNSSSKVFTNASGDFFLMAREMWHKLRGYPELKTHSFIDGYICHMAFASGLKQVVLEGTIFHQEHDRGEHSRRPLTNYQDYENDCESMIKSRVPKIFNNENWGLKRYAFKESTLISYDAQTVSNKIEDYLLINPKDGMVVLPNGVKRVWIDVGAHEGELTLPSLREINDMAVIAFEPIIEKCSSLNTKHPRIFTIPAAVSEDEGYSSFHLTGNYVSSSLHPFSEGGLAIWKDRTGLDVIEKRIVPTMRLDRLIERIPLDYIEFLKVDAQGHDLGVIKSAGEYIHRIGKVQLEVTVTPVQIYEGASDKDAVISFMTSKGFALYKVESQTNGQEENLHFINIRDRLNVSMPLNSMERRTFKHVSVFTPAKAYWNQRFILNGLKGRIMMLAQAVDNMTDLYPFQWAQLMASVLEFKPDLILELGRGRGNSTCAFTEAANTLKNHGNPCRVISLCISDDWEKATQWRVLKVVEEEWFSPLQVIRGNILNFDYDAIFKNSKRCLLFWDAHGFDVAECVLGGILSKIAHLPHLVIMHDLSDARYISTDSAHYSDRGIWKGNNWSGPRVRLGFIDSAVEQSVAIVDFTSRNKIAIDSADHSYDIEIVKNNEKYQEMQKILGNDLFSPGAHWFWFTLNGIMEPVSFPKFNAPVVHNHYEINILNYIQVLGVSFKTAVFSKTDLIEIIPRINRYINSGKTNLACKIIEKELGHLKEGAEVMSRLLKR